MRWGPASLVCFSTLLQGKICFWFWGYKFEVKVGASSFSNFYPLPKFYTPNFCARVLASLSVLEVARTIVGTKISVWPLKMVAVYKKSQLHKDIKSDHYGEVRISRVHGGNFDTPIEIPASTSLCFTLQEATPAPTTTCMW